MYRYLDTPVIHRPIILSHLPTPATWRLYSSRIRLQSAHYRFTCISRFVGTYATIADAIRIPWHVPRLLSHM